jgi:hypothetical protein
MIRKIRSLTAAARLALPPLLLLVLVAARAPEALRYGSLRWGETRVQVAARLAREGFVRAGDDDALPWRGRALGRRAALGVEETPRGGLLAVTLRWRFDTTGEGLQAYRDAARTLTARWGRAELVVDPDLGSPPRRWRYWRPAPGEGEVSAATAWTAANGDAAVLQLDGAHRLWLRLESHEWNAVHGERDSDGDPR